MAKSGDKNGAATGGSGGSTTYSWNGGKVPSTFDQKNFGTTIASDLSKWYQTKPQANPYADYVPYSAQTTGLINQGLGQANDLAHNGVLQGMASGSMLGKGNPYLNDAIAQTRDNVLKDVGSQFTNSGRFGGGSYVDTAVNSLANAENTARFGQYQNDLNNMFTAQGALTNATNMGLGYSNLLDQKARELNASNQNQWQKQNDLPYSHIAQTLGLLNGGVNGNTNQPTNFFDLLGTGANVAGSLLPLLSLLA